MGINSMIRNGRCSIKVITIRLVAKQYNIIITIISEFDGIYEL